MPAWLLYVQSAAQSMEDGSGRLAGAMETMIYPAICATNPSTFEIIMTTKSKKKLRPPFKIHGGKYYLAQWIIENFPEGYEEMTYVEPFIGAGSVFLNKMRSVVEIINDLDEPTTQIWKALRDEPATFIGKLKKIVYELPSFEKFKKKVEEKDFKDYMDHAVSEFALRRMSRGGLRQAFAWSDRKRGGKPGDVNAWETILEELPDISERTQDVRIFNKKAIEIIKAFDDEKALIYCDPPYLAETRTSPVAYCHEMTASEHVELTDVLLGCRSKVMISGYSSPMYKRAFAEWRCIKKKVANHSGQTATKTPRTECLWVNF